MAQRELSLILKLQDDASAALKKVGQTVDDMQPIFSNMAKVGTAAFASITGEIGFAIKAFTESQQQLSVVDGIVDNFSKKTLSQFSGGVTQAKQIIKEWGSEMQAVGGIADEQLATGIAKLLQVTQDWSSAEEAATLAADLSIYKNIEYSDAVDVLSKVLAGNVSILSRYGIQLKDNATIQDAVNALTERAGGLYEKSGKTIAGQMKILKESFGDLQENIGQALIPTLQKVLDIIKPVLDEFIKWTAAHQELTAKVLLFSAAVSGLVAAIGLLGMALPAVITGFQLMLSPAGLVFTLITAALIPALKALWNNWDTVGSKMVVIANKLQDFANNTIQVVIDAISTFMGWIRALWNILNETGFIDYLVYVFQNLSFLVQDQLVPAWNNLMEALQPLMPYIKELAVVFGATLLGALVIVVNILAALIAAITQLVTWVLDLATYIAENLTDALNAVVEPINAVASAFQAVWGWVSRIVSSGVERVLNLVRGGSSSGSTTKVNDAIIAPGGNVITTHPDDYLIATKDPFSLTGGAAPVIVNVYGDVSGTELVSKVSAALALNIKRQIRL
jgi:phage-related protein